MRVAAIALTLLVAVRSARAGSFDHSGWDALLQRYVDDAGRVAYQAFQEHDEAALDAYMAALGGAEPAAWPRDEQLAFWINAYNATMVRAVFEGYTAESVLARYRIFSERTQNIASRARTPDEMEKQIFREFKEPRARFAIAIASMGGPKLRRRAWTADTLKDDLEEAARQFLLDPVRNHIRIGDDTVRLSTLFKWHQADFGGTDDTVLDWVTKHVDEATRGYLEDVRPPVDYFLFDWTLNAQPNQRPE